MSALPDYTWESLTQAVSNLRGTVRRLKSIAVNDAVTRELARGVVQGWFRRVRPDIAGLAMDVSQTDALMQELLRLAGGRSRRTTYSRTLAELEEGLRALEAARELRLGELALAGRSQTVQPQPTEAAILETLRKLVPPAALCYEQALADLADGKRISSRGTAAEARETLREVLDYLAPDERVRGSPGFALEAGYDRPTMKQKVRFILKARRRPEKARKVVEDSVSVIDEYRASAARSAYDRASISAHTATSRDEVRQLKRYVDTVLCELLEIH